MSNFGFLDELRSGFETRGWNPDDLSHFSMEIQETDLGNSSDTDDTASTDQGSDTTDYSLSGGFLKDVPEEHRSILEPYVKKWDAGVSRRFADIHSQYKPYKELGADPEQLTQAWQIFQQLNESPETIYHALAEMFGEQGDSDFDDEDDSEADDSSFQGLPPEFQQRFDQQQQVLEALADYVLGERESKQTQQEDAELDNYLNLLQEEFGEFDEDYVLAKMYKGMDGEAAVKSWKESIQKYVNADPPRANVPPTLSGGGVVPAEPQNLGKIPRKDLKAFVAQVMANANNEG